MAEYQWKYYSGKGWIGDFLCFEPECRSVIKNNTIIIAGEPKAVITGTCDYWGDTKLFIRSLATHKQGVYCAKGKR